MEICACFGLASCKEEKVQIALRIECEGGIYEFSPDVEEIRVERQYDGKEHYHLYEYKFIGRPEGDMLWYRARASLPFLADSEMVYTSFEGITEGEIRSVKESGVYK